MMNIKASLGNSVNYLPGERVWSVFWGLSLNSETVLRREKLSYGGGVEGGWGMW